MTTGAIRTTASAKRAGEHPADQLRNGAHRRFFWRVNHRIGSGWWRMTPGQVGREMRMASHRRAL